MYSDKLNDAEVLDHLGCYLNGYKICELNLSLMGQSRWHMEDMRVHKLIFTWSMQNVWVRLFDTGGARSLTQHSLLEIISSGWFPGIILEIVWKIIK